MMLQGPIRIVFIAAKWGFVLSIVLSLGQARGSATPPQLEWLKERNLELSTREQSVAERFYFIMERSDVRDRKVTRRYDAIVARDGKRVAILTRYGDGVPYCYLSPGLCVMLDPGDTARLLLYKGGAPGFVFRGNGGGIECRVGASTHGSEVVLDLKSLMDVQKGLRETSFDAASRMLLLRTDHATVSVRLSPQPESTPFPVDEWSMQTDQGMVAGLRSFAIKERPPVDILSVTEQQVRKLGVPVLDVTEAGMKGEVLPETGELKDPAKQVIALKFGTLFGAAAALEGDAPEDIYRAFIYVVNARDAAAIRSLIVPNPDAEILWSGERLSPAMLEQMRVYLGRLPIMRLKVGDLMPLLGGGTMLVREGMISDDHLILWADFQGAKLPFHLLRLDGAWKVDAGWMIAGRLAAKAATRPSTMQSGSNGQR